MPIPAETSGRDITSSLKAILSHQGDLIQFRGSASIGLNHIPEEKRSDLQLSGCHLIDCPHHGRKEGSSRQNDHRGCYAFCPSASYWSDPLFHHRQGM